MLKQCFTFLVIIIVCVQTQATVLNHSQNLSSPEHYDYLEVYNSPPDTTTINITGAMIQQYDTYDSSITNMFDGHVMDLNSYNSSEINVNGGSVVDFTAYQLSVFNLSGGSSLSIRAFDSSTINLLCGDIGWIYASSNSQINIYGYGFEYIASETTDPFVIGNGGELTGYWQNGESFRMLFNINDSGYSSYDHVNLILIPEPMSIILLASGGLFIRKSV